LLKKGEFVVRSLQL